MDIEQVNRVLVRAVSSLQDSELEQVSEATFDQDTKARREAVRVWNKFTDHLVWLDKKPEPVEIDYHGQRLGFAFEGRGLSSESGLPKGLTVFLLPKSGATLGLYMRHRHYGHMILLNGVVDKSSSLDSAYTRLKNYKEFFVHEYIHYLDQGRHKSLRSIRGAKGLAYFQSPFEFNAYFQELATAIDESMDRLIDLGPSWLSRYYKEAFPSFNSFYSYYSKYGSTSGLLQQFRETYAGSKWEKKLMKRLYTLYKGLKKELEQTLKGAE